MAGNKAIKNAIEAIDAFIDESLQEKFNTFGTSRNTVYLAFYTNNQLNEEIKTTIPIRELGKVDSFLKQFSQQPWYNDEELSKMRDSLTNIKKLLLLHNQNEYMKLFYSWQSDMPNNTNRGFIEKALETAIKEINEKYSLNVELDSDTRGEPGSPDIANTIMEKIKNSIAFVADVSYVTSLGNKGIPNSNVMFELGYAMSVLTDKNVIMVFNQSSGELNKMPFDLGLKRQLVFSCNETDNEKSTERKKLSKQFYSRIETILRNSEYIT